MSSGGGDGDGREEERASAWSVFDSVKVFPSSSPEALMADIDAAIAAFEYARATSAAVRLPLSSSASEAEADPMADRDRPAEAAPVYDRQVADEAYKAACASLAAGKADDAIQSLHVALSKCPPDKASALAKLRSLLDIASSQQQQQQQQQQKQQR